MPTLVCFHPGSLLPHLFCFSFGVIRGHGSILPNCVQSKYGKQGSAIAIHQVHIYTYFYWRAHDIGHVYVDMYPYFFSMLF